MSNFVSELQSLIALWLERGEDKLSLLNDLEAQAKRMQEEINQTEGTN